MTLRPRIAIALLAPLAAGAVGFMLLGNGPGQAPADFGREVDWVLPSPDARELQGADEVWSTQVPWGARQVSAGSPEVPDAAPPPMLVGVVAANGGFRAVFLLPQGGEARFAPGESLPGGGRVDEVTRFVVRWTDARGTQHEQELLADPLPPATGGSH